MPHDLIWPMKCRYYWHYFIRIVECNIPTFQQCGNERLTWLCVSRPVGNPLSTILISRRCLLTFVVLYIVTGGDGTDEGAPYSRKRKLHESRHLNFSRPWNNIRLKLQKFNSRYLREDSKNIMLNSYIINIYLRNMYKVVLLTKNRSSIFKINRATVKIIISKSSQINKYVFVKQWWLFLFTGQFRQ